MHTSDAQTEPTQLLFAVTWQPGFYIDERGMQKSRYCLMSEMRHQWCNVVSGHYVIWRHFWWHCCANNAFSQTNIGLVISWGSQTTIITSFTPVLKSECFALSVAGGGKHHWKGTCWTCDVTAHCCKFLYEYTTCVDVTRGVICLR